MTLAVQQRRKATSAGSVRWIVPTLFAVTSLPWLVAGLLAGIRSVAAEEPYLIPGRNIGGLFRKSEAPRSALPSERWEPEVADNIWKFIVVHHSATASGSVESIHAEHRNRKDGAGNPWLGIGYHFVIGNGRGMRDGRVEATFRWTQQIHGAHSGDAMFNARGIGICLIGDFEKGAPSKSQMLAVRELVCFLAQRYDIPPEGLVGHSAVRSTACPGRYFPLKDIRQLIGQTTS